MQTSRVFVEKVAYVSANKRLVRPSMRIEKIYNLKITRKLRMQQEKIRKYLTSQYSKKENSIGLKL